MENSPSLSYAVGSTYSPIICEKLSKRNLWPCWEKAAQQFDVKSNEFMNENFQLARRLIIFRIYRRRNTLVRSRGNFIAIRMLPGPNNGTVGCRFEKKSTCSFSSFPLGHDCYFFYAHFYYTTSRQAHRTKKIMNDPPDETTSDENLLGKWRKNTMFLSRLI